MGLRMDDLHTPSIGSSSTTGGVGNGLTESSSLEQLSKQKEALESELSALGSVLDSHGVHMRTTLTTFDGFPRSDIDVAQIRTTRARIIHLRNDHKALLTRIENAVHARFAELAATQIDTPSSPTSSASTRYNVTTSTVPGENIPMADQTPTSQPPFARVNSVSPGSPAAEAGLQAGDRITKFGDADWLNHEKLARVAQVVGRNEGRPIAVSVLRGAVGEEVTEQHTTLTLSLTPRRDWGGRGTLGCHLIPL